MRTAPRCFTDPVVVMLACGLVLLVATGLAVRWRSYAFALPDWAERDPAVATRPALQLCWLLVVGMLTGYAVGATVVGPAGRLAMRLLAATSPDATGLRTEADETVGQITVAGTIAFVVFVGLVVGLLVGLVYVLVSTALPRGIVGGVVYGLVLLVVLGSVLDPLRADNEDFDIVGPGWLAVVTFASMALLTGGVAAAFAGRIAAALPTPRLVWAWWLVPVGAFSALVLVLAPVALVVVVVGGFVFLVTAGLRSTGEDSRGRGRRVLQGVLAAAVLVTLPGFVLALDDIVSS